MWPARRILKYATVAGAITGTAVSLHANQYNVDSIGAVRLGRAAATVSLTFLISPSLSQTDS